MDELNNVITILTNRRYQDHKLYIELLGQIAVTELVVATRQGTSSIIDDVDD